MDVRECFAAGMVLHFGVWYYFQPGAVLVPQMLMLVYFESLPITGLHNQYDGNTRSAEWSSTLSILQSPKHFLSISSRINETDGWINGWMDGRTDERINGPYGRRKVKVTVSYPVLYPWPDFSGILQMFHEVSQFEGDARMITFLVMQAVFGFFFQKI